MTKKVTLQVVAKGYHLHIISFLFERQCNFLCVVQQREGISLVEVSILGKCITKDGIVIFDSAQ